MTEEVQYDEDGNVIETVVTENMPDTEPPSQEIGTSENDTESKSQIPPVEPDISALSAEAQDALLELEALKEQAKSLGISFHPNIGFSLLKERIEAHLIPKETDQTQDKSDQEYVRLTNEHNAALRVAEEQKDTAKRTKAKQRADALALKRVTIMCLDPSKRAFTGDILTVSNSVVGTDKKYFHFGVPWHITTMMYNALKEKKHQTFYETRLDNGEKGKRAKLVSTYSIVEMAPLSEVEIEQLQTRQSIVESGIYKG